MNFARIIVNNIKFVLAVLLLTAYASPTAKAAGSAQFYLTPASGSYSSGQTFTADIKIKSDTSVNALTAKLSYPLDKLSVNGISYNNSAFEVQAESKAADGLIVISRGTVSAVSGDKLIATITFTAKVASGNAAVDFDKTTTAVYAGNSIPSSFSGASYSFRSAAAGQASPTPTATSVDVNAGNATAYTKLVVVDANNKPVKDASVTIDGVTKKTNAKGEVEYDLSLGQKTATIKYGNTTQQKTFALGMATKSDNPTEVKSAIAVASKSKNYAPVVGILLILTFVAGFAYFVIKKYRFIKSPVNNTLDADSIVPAANNIARQNLAEPKSKNHKSDLKKDEPIDNIEQAPKE